MMKIARCALLSARLKGLKMKKTIVLYGILLLFGQMVRSQSGPFNHNAAVTLDIQPVIPTAGSDFSIAVKIDLQGVANNSGTPAALGGFVIPVAFDNSRITLKSVAKGSASEFTSALTTTDIARANARGFVTLINSQIGSGSPTGTVHVATLTFTANQGGKVQFNVNSARASYEGSLASTYSPDPIEGPASIAYSNLVTSVEIKQGKAPYRLIYPLFVSTSSDFQGVAIVNESSESATLTFHAFGADGKLLAGMGMANPSTFGAVAAHTQVVRVVEEVFALRDTLGTDRGWIDVESTSSNASGFFLIGHTVNGITNELDGADVSHALAAHAIFPVMGEDTARDTKICVVNPGSIPATGSLKLQKGDGTTQQIIPVSIPAQGVFEQTVQSTMVPGDGYAELEMSSGSVAGLERFGNAKALACLAAQDVDKAANVLCAPHLASGKAGARYFTEINVINTSARAASVTFRLLNNEGKEIAGSVARAIDAKGQLRIRADRLFGLPDPATAEDYRTGVIMVEADRELVGNVTFGNTDGDFLSSLPLLSTSSAKREIYLDHVALGSIAPITYWTGIALVNASPERDAQVEIRLYRPDGELVGQTTRTIPGKGRLLKLVSELGPSFNVNQFGGFLRVTSDVEVFAFMLFGDTGSTFLSAVPVR
jgi:hypothetical protein